RRKRRYIFVYNPEREKQDLEDLDRKIEAVEKILTEQLGKEETKNKLGNLRSLVSFKGNEIKLNDKKIKEIKSLAGRFLIITNSSLGKEEAVKTYKDLCKIERAFRTIGAGNTGSYSTMHSPMVCLLSRSGTRQPGREYP
ncbi:MAG: hypothetical protein ACP5R0_05655, partial [Thermoplasmata archaeon]